MSKRTAIEIETQAVEVIEPIAADDPTPWLPRLTEQSTFEEIRDARSAIRGRTEDIIVELQDLGYQFAKATPEERAILLRESAKLNAEVQLLAGIGAIFAGAMDAVTSNTKILRCIELKAEVAEARQRLKAEERELERLRATGDKLGIVGTTARVSAMQSECERIDFEIRTLERDEDAMVPRVKCEAEIAGQRAALEKAQKELSERSGRDNTKDLESVISNHNLRIATLTSDLERCPDMAVFSLCDPSGWPAKALNSAASAAKSIRIHSARVAER
ncbi:MAG: hypothetical protein WC655_19245 [Candidatus Hydrogenedentales bacterium]|jgi:hypothetical protein